MTAEELHELRRQRHPIAGPGGLPALVAAAGYVLAVPDPAWDLPAFATAVPDGTGAAWSQELEASIAGRQICELQAFGPPLVYLPPELLTDAFVWCASRLTANRRDRPRTASSPARPPLIPHLSPLAAQIADLLWASPPLSASQLRDAVGPQRTSFLAILAAGRELARELQILRVGGSLGDPLWSPVSAAFPAARRALAQSSRDRALAALVTKYLWLMVAAGEEELAAFFGPLVSHSRLQPLLHGLATAGVLASVEIAGRPAVALAAVR